MNRKVILYIAMSLDGYIADNNGSVAWLEGHSDNSNSDNGYNDFIKDIDTIVMGMTTYEQVVNELSPNNWPYQGMNSYVFTHKTVEDNKNAEFVSSNIAEFINKLKNEDGKSIWICGGANIVNQLIKAELIDEYHLTIMPIVLGKGIRLFSDTNPTSLLKMKQTKEINGILDVVYTRRV